MKFVEQPPRPPSCRTCPVHACTLYGCDERERDEVLSLRREFRVVPAQAPILREGAVLSGYLTLQSGWAFRYRPMPEGGRAILSFVLPGDPVFLPMLWGARPNSSVRALTDAGLCVFDSGEVLAAVRSHNSLFGNLGRYIGREVVASDERNAGCGRLSARERVARLLLNLYGRMTRYRAVQDQTIDFPLRQHHVADALGVTTVHVSRVMSDLRRERLIEIKSKRLKMIDLPAMMDIAGQEEPSAFPGEQDDYG